MFKSYINRRSVTVRKTHSGISCDWQTINFWSVNFTIERCSAPGFCGFAAHLLQCRDGNPLCPIDLGLCSFPPSMPRDKINKINKINLKPPEEGPQLTPARGAPPGLGGLPGVGVIRGHPTVPLGVQGANGFLQEHQTLLLFHR